MKTLILALTLLSGAALAASAQDARPPDAPIPTATTQNATAFEVVVGRVAWEVDPNEVAQVCAEARDETLDGATLTLRVFVRTTDAWLALPAYRSAATGAVADAAAGDCLKLDPEPINR